jgi:hypothetical protein
MANSSALAKGSVPEHLAWLADAPLFIDGDQIERFYDAVVRPSSREESRKLIFTQESMSELAGKGTLEAGLELSEFGSLVSGLFGLKPSLTASLEGDLSKQDKKGQTIEITITDIDTPQRQLVLLVLHYISLHRSRLFLARNTPVPEWSEPKLISAVPRGLVFIDLPGKPESAQRSLPQTKLIPMAAEFKDGKFELFFKKIRGKNGDEPPPFSSGILDAKEQLRKYHEYWQWFDTNFNPRKLIEIVEEASTANGRIQWIDYRLALSAEGHTLHLHLAANGLYDAGVFAYNFINRGFSHGLRIVGTLKSGPDINVLAVYEK